MAALFSSNMTADEFAHLLGADGGDARPGDVGGAPAFGQYRVHCRLQSVGVGGQVDFVRGASASKGGVSIMAMPSTVKGKISKIVPLLDEGAAVTTSRNDVDYIVTEYGMVNLKGMSTWERSEALIGIAHPDFRDELIKSAEAMHIWRKSNKR